MHKITSNPLNLVPFFTKMFNNLKFFHIWICICNPHNESLAFNCLWLGQNVLTPHPPSPFPLFLYIYIYIYKNIYIYICSGLLLVLLDRFQISIDYSTCRMSQQKKKFNILFNKWEHQMLWSRNWTPDINVNNPVCIGTLVILLHIPLLSFDVACDVDTLNFIDESVMSHSIKCIWNI